MGDNGDLDHNPAAIPVEESAIGSETIANHIALLQQLYQNKHAELLKQLQQSQNALTQEYLQGLLQRQASSSSPSGATLPTANPLLGLLRQASSEQSTDELDPAGPPTGPANNSPLSVKENIFSMPRQRRTLSGSSQTISQTTRDRLKTMIASKKQKKQLHGYPSTGSTSTSNIPLSAGSAAKAPHLGNGTPTWMNTSADGFSPGENAAMRSSLKENKQFTTSTPHFEPYPHPSPVTAAAAVAAEFQLRKTSSEPNLKMKLRQRLLSKGSSPVTHQQSTPSQGGNHSVLQRCDSDSTPMEMLKASPLVSALAADAAERLQEAAAKPSLPPALRFPMNTIIPSPSLPNLCNSFENFQLDYATNLMMQASFSSFLSLPSLLKNPLFQPNSMFEPCSSSNIVDDGVMDVETNRSSVKFDNRTFGTQLPAGGYPSLLKQQLRDLVLRRKSLVREEPEDESAVVEAFAQRWHALNQNSQLKTGLAYDAAMSKHQCLCSENNNHVEHGGRVQSIWSRLNEAGLINACERLCVKKASLDLLKLAHSSTYVTFFAVSPTACLKLDPAVLPLKSFVQLPCGGIGVDSDTYFNDANTQMAIRVAVGLLVELATQVVEGKLRNGFACIRPPGHHAEREQAMGFCFFNNVSIAARHIQQRYANVCKRIAIVDWDVHHGNGTQLCFESDPDILYVSLHRHDNGNFFPGTGAVTEVGVGEGKGFTVNIPFSGDVMGDAEYLAAWRVLVLPLLDAFKPDMIFVSSGFDAAKGHPAALGGYEISPQLFGYFTRSLMSYANGKVILALEGGYDLSSICDSAEECVKALCSDGGDISALSATELDKIPNQSAQETIQKVIAVHKKHWSCLTGVQGINTSELHWQTISSRFSSLTVHS